MPASLNLCEEASLIFEAFMFSKTLKGKIRKFINLWTTIISINIFKK